MSVFNGFEVPSDAGHPTVLWACGSMFFVQCKSHIYALLRPIGPDRVQCVWHLDKGLEHTVWPHAADQSGLLLWSCSDTAHHVLHLTMGTSHTSVPATAVSLAGAWITKREKTKYQLTLLHSNGSTAFWNVTVSDDKLSCKPSKRTGVQCILPDSLVLSCQACAIFAVDPLHYGLALCVTEDKPAGSFLVWFRDGRAGRQWKHEFAENYIAIRAIKMADGTMLVGLKRRVSIEVSVWDHYTVSSTRVEAAMFRGVPHQPLLVPSDNGRQLVPVAIMRIHDRAGGQVQCVYSDRTIGKETRVK